MRNVPEAVVPRSPGKATATVAKLDGSTGVFTVLTDEHRRMAELLERISSCDNSEERAELWNQLRCDLLAHEHAEIQEIYPRLNGSSEAILGEHARDVQQLESLILDMNGKHINSPAWKHSLEQVKRFVREHAEQEEKEFFPKMRSVIGDDMAQQLEERYEVRKRVILASINYRFS